MWWERLGWIWSTFFFFFSFFSKEDRAVDLGWDVLRNGVGGKVS